MRGALIGCGFFATNHLHAWREMAADGVELVAVCDLDEGKARAGAAILGGARVHTDAATLFESEHLDFVDIATRMDTHRALAELATDHRIPFIVQKPLAPDWDGATAIVERARAAGVRMAVHENFRFQAPMRRVKALLDDGAIGAATWARIAFRTGFDVYANQPYFHGEARLVILDLGVHLLDLARFLLGEAVHLSCETQRRNPANRGEDTATMMLRHASGAVSVVECTYEARLDPDPFPQTLLWIEGERGSVVVEPGLTARLTQDGATRRIELRSPALGWTEEPWHVVQESVLRTQQAILGAWSESREAETSGADNLKTLALVEAAYAAAATARAVPTWPA